MPSVFGCITSGSRYGNVPNELVHRAGPPFLDNHYRGYQYIYIYLLTCVELIKRWRMTYEIANLSWKTVCELRTPLERAHFEILNATL